MRAVTPDVSLGIKLSGEKDFKIIRTPPNGEGRNFEFEIQWKIAAKMEGRKIILHSIGRPAHSRYILFVPILQGIRQMRSATDHVTISKVSGQHFAFPGVAQMPNGDIAVVSRQGKEHAGPFGRIVLARSRDGGRSWSKPQSIYDSLSDDRNPAILTLPEGRVVLTFCTFDSWQKSATLRQRYPAQAAIVENGDTHSFLGHRIMFSRDSGHTWSKPQRIPNTPPHGLILGSDNNLYSLGGKNLNGKQIVIIRRSNDSGKTWTEYAKVARSALPGQDKTEEVYREPNLAILPDGKWVMVIRVNLDGYVRQSFSNDRGLHWTRPQKLKIRGHPQHLLPLKDGRLPMTYGYRFYPFGIRACLSLDGGKTWDLKNEIVIRHGGGNGDLGYPSSIELDDGRVFTVYYYNHGGGDRYIEGTFYRP